MAHLRSYFLSLLLSTIAVVATVMTANYLIDPYYTHQWDTPLLQRLSPPQQKIVPWAKTYAVSRYRPDVVLLGSSRSEIGLPAQSTVLQEERTFNLAISGASLGDAISMLTHTSTFHRPTIVIWGLDYGWQFREKTGNTDLNQELLAASPGKQFLLNLKRTLSMAMATDTYKILFDPAWQKCEPILTTHGTKPDRCLEYIMTDEGGTPTAFDKIINRGDRQPKPADIPTTLRLLDKVVKEHCQQGTAFRFFFHPIHALAELSYWENDWQEVDRWKKELVQLFDRQRRTGCDVRLYDFSGYNAITTEPVPQVTGRDDMAHYWEHSHYRAEVGQQMLAMMRAKSFGVEPGEFGAELTPATIGPHLEAYRRNREAYCVSHPWETRNKAACHRDLVRE